MKNQTQDSSQKTPSTTKDWELKGRVLIVEDDEVMGNWISRKLTNCGLESELVLDAASAIKELELKRYHAVVSDVYLGDSTKGGLEFIENVKKMDIPVIVITARADLDIARSCLNSGVHRFIEKPFEMNTLIQALADAWENPRGLSTLVERYLDTNKLTVTEKKVARLALKGLSNREIAEVNGNTEKTIKFHMTIIYNKCDVASRGEFFNSIIPT